MGTNAIIVKENINGKFEGVRLNYDGYLEHAGRILHEHYNNEDKIDVLLKQGDLSILDTESDKCMTYNRDSANKEQNAQTFVRLSDFGSVP